MTPTEKARIETLERELAERTAHLTRANRELQVEAAVERVRSRAMAMERSEDIRGVAIAILGELQDLHVGPLIAATISLEVSPGRVRHFDVTGTDPDTPGEAVSMDITFDLSSLPREHFFVDEWRHQGAYWTNHATGEGFRVGIDWLFDYAPVNAAEFRKMFESGVMTEFWQGVVPLVEGRLSVGLTAPPPAELEWILPRFGAAFDLAHRRFKDLEKAEGQAREALVELALQRIRAQAMAMRESADLLDIVVTMRNEFTALGHEAHYFWHMRWLDSTYEKAMTSGDGTRIGMVMELPRGFHGNPAMTSWEQSDEPVGVFTFDADGAIDYVHRMVETGRFDQIDPNPPTDDDIRHIEGLTFVMARTTHGEIGYSLPGVVPDPPGGDLATLARFAGAFDLAYRRFEDLKQAERQAREASIEAALERVRSATSAMHSSEDIGTASIVLFDQLRALGIDPLRCGVGLPRGDGTYEFWAAATDEHGGSIRVIGHESVDVHPAIRRAFEGWRGGESHQTGLLEVDDLARYYAAALPTKPQPYWKKRIVEGGMERVSFSTFPFSDGWLYIFLGEEPTVDTIDTVLRFTRVYDQTYRRYKELREAEAHARESDIELALERVRARALAMRTADELEEVTLVLRDEMGRLGQPELESAAIHLYHEDTREVEWWGAFQIPGKEGGLTKVGGRLNLDAVKLLSEFYGHYAAGETEYTMAVSLSMPEMTEWLAMVAREVPEIMEALDGAPPERAWWNGAAFSGGAVITITYVPPTADLLELQRRVANAFDLAYRRFVDLQATEEENRRVLAERDRAEAALAELRATQKQLVEQEKLASLGQLTAGIAHEIKNPLNFVNNFAEVNAELADELAEAVASGAVGEASSIIADLRENAVQITKHGKRADSIVRAMMQHARGGASEKEDIDVNAFLEEYAALAWHGMRARQEGFQVEIIRAFADDAGTIRAMPQELGRVILNLLNNAFDALKGVAGPRVTIASRRTDKEVVITVSDNGPGIPDEIREKILEPFFTTKATGEGTGLGLSLSYDIVTKGHGGTMTVGKSVDGGAEFVVSIPT